MKKFLVSKNDETKRNFVEKAIAEIKPDNVYVLCEKDRQKVYTGIEAIVLPLKDLNSAENWITFVNTFSKNSLLVIDNVLKFIFFGDGKKKYLKDISQSINNIIVTDIVPFYSEPHEIFYPFWFLGKEILGYNSLNTFRANHLEEKADGTIDFAHSFNILKDKIKDYYVQDYDNFFSNLKFECFEANEFEKDMYESAKAKAKENFTNPIKFYNDISPVINMCLSRYECINQLLHTLDRKKTVLVNNCSSFQNRHKKEIIFEVDFLTFHSELSLFDKYENIVFMQMPVVKPMNLFYLLQKNKNLFQIVLNDNKLEDYYKQKIYNNELRKQFDTAFYYPNL
ncbi:hypothetical protein FACS189434_07830 [Bacteroidia bacterium]|nr:hypothetical protein FACS189434_07830 [Bacteroidia bacterium]